MDEKLETIQLKQGNIWRELNAVKTIITQPTAVNLFGELLQGVGLVQALSYAMSRYHYSAFP